MVRRDRRAAVRMVAVMLVIGPTLLLAPHPLPRTPDLSAVFPLVNGS